jgi:hypothetical protein
MGPPSVRSSGTGALTARGRTLQESCLTTLSQQVERIRLTRHTGFNAAK